MRCEKIAVPGATMIICGGRQRRQFCQVPGCGRPSEALCDFPLRGRVTHKTCDMRLCAAHRIKQSGEDRDYCPAHAKQGAML